MALFFSSRAIVYPLFAPIDNCAHVNPRHDLVPEKNMSEWKPSFSCHGLSDGSLHFKGLLGVILVLASTSRMRCVVAGMVRLEVSKLRCPYLSLHSSSTEGAIPSICFTLLAALTPDHDSGEVSSMIWLFSQLNVGFTYVCEVF